MPARRSKKGRAGSSHWKLAQAADDGGLVKVRYPKSQFGKRYSISERRWYPVQRTDQTLQDYGYSRAVATSAQLARRDRDMYRGKGLYTGRGGYWGRKIGSMFGLGDVGDKLGDLASNAIRAAVPGGGMLMDAANLAGAGLRATGLGSYAVNDTVGGGDGIPSFNPGPSDVRGNMCVAYEEFVGTIYGGDASHLNFNIQTLPLNPGMEQTFPWLSQVAQNYEEYTLRSCMFTFKSRVSDFAANNGQVGEIIFATQYNAEDDPFTQKSDMLRYALSGLSKVTQDQLHGVECDPAKLSMAVGKYVRAGPPPSGADKKTYDHGTLNVAVCGIPAAFANQALGELYVSYVVELRKPKQFVNKGWGILRDTYVLPRQVLPWTDTQAVALTSLSVLTGQQNSIGTKLDLSQAPNPRIVLPANYEGTLKMVVTVDAEGVAPGHFALGVQGNVQSIDDMWDGTAWQHDRQGQAGLAGGGAHTNVLEYHFRVKEATGGVDNAVSFAFTSGGTWADGIPTGCTIDISELNTRFDFDQDGSNDQIVLVNKLGALASP